VQILGQIADQSKNFERLVFTAIPREVLLLSSMRCRGH
jgi:hypothetical protein